MVEESNELGLAKGHLNDLDKLYKKMDGFIQTLQELKQRLEEVLCEVNLTHEEILTILSWVRSIVIKVENFAQIKTMVLEAWFLQGLRIEVLNDARSVESLPRSRESRLSCIVDFEGGRFGICSTKIAERFYFGDLRGERFDFDEGGW